MALLFIKGMILPGSATEAKGRYSPLPLHNHERDARSSTSSSSTALDTYAEKTSSPAESSTRIATINPRTISDAIIGLSDGLTVPFALTAGLSALGNTSIVLYGGLAELIAGGISMGLGGYLGAKSEAEAYQAKLAETRSLVREDAGRAERMVAESFADFGLSRGVLDGIAGSLTRDEGKMVDFLMRFYHQQAEADFTQSRAYVSGLTISGGYLVGGLVPLLPYLFFATVQEAFVGSVVVMILALFIFGCAKSALVGEKSRWACAKSGVQMVAMGGVAAGAAMLSVKGLSGSA